MIQFKTSALRLLALAGFAILASASTLGAQTLTWSANTESNLAGYRIQYGTVSGSPNTTIDVGRVTSRQFTGLQAGVTYYFRVVAYNTLGHTSAPSTQVSYTVPATSTAPTIASVSPASGPTAGGTVITITGSRFVSGARVSIGSLAASNVVFLSSTQLRATVPAATAGARDVRVTNPDGRYAIRSGGFTYGTTTSSSLSVTGVSPTSGPTSGGTVITVTGSGFVSGARVSIGTLVASNVVFVSSTQLRATTPAATAGTRDVRVTNPDGRYAIRAGGFTHGTAPTTSSLTLTSVSPASGPTSGGTVITVTGSGFVSGARVSLGTLVTSNVVFVSSTQLRATTPAATAGARDVRVTNPNGQYAIRAGAFTYGTSTSTTGTRPTVTSVSPASGPRTGGTTITVTGSGFVSGARVSIGTLVASNVVFVSSTQLRARTPYSSTTGARDVRVTNPNAAYGIRSGGFTYTSSTTSATSTLTSASATSETLSSARSIGDGAETGVLSAEVLSADTEALDGALADPVAQDAGDVDGDGLPGDWETRFGLDPTSDAGDDGAAGDPDGDGVSNDAELAAGSHPRGSSRRYLAEGIESAQMHTRLAIANPEASEAHVLLTFMRADGTTTRWPLDVPARARRTVDLSTLPELAGTSFSTVLESDQPVALDRLVSLDSDGRATTVASAVDEASATWSLPAASTAGAFELFYLVLNPGETDARVEVRYLPTDGGAAIVRSQTVAAHSRATIWVDRQDPALAAADVAAEVTSLDGVPIVVERTLYVTEAGSPVPLSGSTQAGLATPQSPDAAGSGRARWLLAEGELGGTQGATTTLTLINGAAATDAAVTLLFEDGPEVSASFPLRAGARFEVPLARAFPEAVGRRFSVIIDSTDPAATLDVDRAIAWSAEGSPRPTASGGGSRLP